MYHNKIQTIGCGYSNYIYSSLGIPLFTTFPSTYDCGEISEVSIPHVKMEILLLYYPKIQELLKRTFLKTIEIKNSICFSAVFNVSQGPLLNAKERFSLAAPVSESLWLFSLVYYF